MKQNEVKEKIKQITDTCIGIKVYFIDNTNKIFDSDVDNDVLDGFREEFVRNLKTKYSEHENFTCPTLSAADDRSHALYYFDFDVKPKEFDLLTIVNSITADQKIDKYQVKNYGLSNLRGIVIRLKNRSGQVMSFYQHMHNLSLITPEKGAFLTTHKTRVVKLDHDVLRLGYKFVFAMIEDTYLIENISVLEKDLGFDKVIHEKAVKYCKALIDTSLVEKIDKFQERVNNETLFARKFVKIFKNSAVIEQKLTNDQIISFAMNKPFYKDKLRLTKKGNQFDLNSIQRCSAFLSLLDDEFLKSELTGQDYIARAKDRA